ncbi:energy transducer TonB [Niveispirillum lacus]|uniref:energy transducer TonB n=1 Tax=Niveispirillum lacus TaxID=1981099 RepID=UPI001A9C441F|nr:energy transducer TonB [Niveispirillum lacus]
MVGIAVVILLHVGVIYALATGLAQKAVSVIADPIKTEIIEEIAPPPEEVPPPPPPPKFDTPPPPFIPPPEIQISQPPPPTSTAIQTTTAERPPVVQPPTRMVAPPPPPTGGKIDVKSLARNRPEYPAQSIRLEEAGTTVMRLYCNADGRISDATIEKSSGFERLDQAWMKEAKRGRWRCEPPTVDGKPQGAWIPSMVPLTFRLEDAR